MRVFYGGVQFIDWNIKMAAYFYRTFPRMMFLEICSASEMFYAVF